MNAMTKKPVPPPAVEGPESAAACRMWLEARLGSRIAKALRRLGKAQTKKKTPHVLPEDEARVRAAYEGACVYCAQAATRIDFLVPLRREGTTVATNLIPACDACRKDRRERHLDEFLEQRPDLDAKAVFARIARGTAHLRHDVATPVRRAA